MARRTSVARLTDEDARCPYPDKAHVIFIGDLVTTSSGEVFELTNWTATTIEFVHRPDRSYGEHSRG